MDAWERNWVDYYKELGVPPTATQKQVKRAYRKLAKQHHPDVNSAGGDLLSDRMKRINAANDVLSKVKDRSRYDFAYKTRNPGSVTDSSPSNTYRQQPTGTDGPTSYQRHRPASQAERRQSADAADWNARWNQKAEADYAARESRWKATARDDVHRTSTSNGKLPTPPAFVRRGAWISVGALVVILGIWSSSSGGNPNGDSAESAASDFQTPVHYQQPVIPTFVISTLDVPSFEARLVHPMWSRPTSAESTQTSGRAFPTPPVVPTLHPRVDLTRIPYPTIDLPLIKTIDTHGVAYELMLSSAENNLWVSAISLADKILSEDPSYLDVADKRKVYIVHLYESGYSAYNEAKWEAAVELLTFMREIDPDNAEIDRMLLEAQRAVLQ